MVQHWSVQTAQGCSISTGDFMSLRTYKRLIHHMVEHFTRTTFSRLSPRTKMTGPIVRGPSQRLVVPNNPQNPVIVSNKPASITAPCTCINRTPHLFSLYNRIVELIVIINKLSGCCTSTILPWTAIWSRYCLLHLQRGIPGLFNKLFAT